MTNKCFKGLMIEPTNICNLRCPICVTGSGRDDRPKGAMAFRQFKQIIDTVKDFLNLIYLWGFGEPFLAPDIMKMIDYAGENNLSILIHTNGNVLNKRVLNQFKKNYKVNISFSIDGVTQKVYSYYRKGGVLKKAIDNLKYLVNLKRKYDLFNLQIIWQFLITKGNKHEISQVYKLAKNIGVDRLRLKTISINKKHPCYNDFMPKNTKYHRIKSRAVNFENCYFINPGMPNILWNGDVIPCCDDYFRQYLMGNAFKENLLDIWNGKKYKKFRDDYKNEINDLCNSRQSCRFKSTSKSDVADFNFKPNQ